MALTLTDLPTRLIRQVESDPELERQALEAFDPATDPTRLSELALAKYDVLSEIKKGACRNPSLPHLTMAKVVKHGPAPLRQAVAENPDLFPALQRYLLLDPAVSV